MSIGLQHDAPASSRVLHYCKTCQRETPHTIDGTLQVIFCVCCVQNAINEELDRD